MERTLKRVTAWVMASVFCMICAFSGQAYAFDCRIPAYDSIPVGAEFDAGVVGIFADDYENETFEWEQTGGFGEVEQVTDPPYVENVWEGYYPDLRFKALKAGDVSIAFTGRTSEEAFNSTANYTIVEPNGTYGLEYDDSIASSQVGEESSIHIKTWADQSYCYATADLAYPRASDFTWSATGDGAIEGNFKEGTSDLSRPSVDFNFKAVTAGDVTLTIASKDGKWSDTVNLTIEPKNDPDPDPSEGDGERPVNLLDTLELYCTRVATSSDGSGWSGGSDSAEALSAEYFYKGGSFDLEILSSNYESVSGDFTWSQTGAGKVEGTLVSSTPNPKYTFDCTGVGAVTLTIASKDGAWSRSVSLYVHTDASLPAIWTYRGYRDYFASSYDGVSGLYFYLADETQDAWRPSYYKKLKKNTLHEITEVRAVSLDESIAKPGKIYWFKDGDWAPGDNIDCTMALTIFKPGTVKIRMVDAKYGEKVCKDFTVKISEKAFNNYWQSSQSVKSTLQYGSTSFSVQGNPGDTATFKLGSKTFTQAIPASGKVNFKGLPLVKAGTKGTVTFKRASDGHTRNLKVAVKDTKAKVKVAAVKTSSKKMTVTLKKAVKGDKVKIKVGGKTYTKKVKKTASSLKVSQKIAKQKKGTKIKVTVYNKFNQKRCAKTIKVK